VLNGNNGVYVSAEQTTPTQFYSNLSINGTEGSPLPTNVTGPVQTVVALRVQPSRVGLGSTVSFRVTVSPSPPTAEDIFANVTVFILCPDGTVDLLGPFQTDQNGLFLTSYVPGMIGGYKIHANYAGQFFASQNVTYLAAESSETGLAVSSEVSPLGEPIVVADTNNDASLRYVHQVAVRLPNGTLCATFATNLLGTINNCAVYVISSNDNGAMWGSPVKISNGTGMDGWACGQGMYGTVIAADSNSNVYVAWTGINDSSTYFQVWCARSQGSTWEKPVQISEGAAAGVQAFDVSIAVDGNDKVHLVWCANKNGYSSQKIFYAKYDGKWSTPTIISHLENSMYPSIAVDSKNYLHVVWTSGSDSIFGERRVCYTRWNGAWQTPIVISTNPELNGHYMDNPCIAVDSNDNLHVVWDGICNGIPMYSQIWYTKYTKSWSTPARISNASGMESSPQQYPTIGVTSGNKVCVLWSHTLGHTLFYSSYDSSWSTPLEVEAEASYPSFVWSYYPPTNVFDEAVPYFFLQGSKLTFNPAASSLYDQSGQSDTGQVPVGNQTFAGSFGYMKSNSMFGSSGTKYTVDGSRFTLNIEANVTSMSCLMNYMSDPSHPTKNYSYAFAIYGDNNGAVGNLLAQTVQGTMFYYDNNVPYWYTLDFLSVVHLSPAAYWLVIVDNASQFINICCSVAEGYQSVSSFIGGMAFPASLPSPVANSNYVFSIYASWKANVSASLNRGDDVPAVSSSSTVSALTCSLSAQP
jgi:hypothetical protein